MIHLTIPTLTPGKQDRLERTLKWLTNLRENLRIKSQEIYSLRTRLSEAEANKLTLAKAAFDATAAGKLSGVERQIKMLAPIVQQKEGELARDVETIARQIGSVRQDDIGASLGDALLGQVKEQVETLIAPLFLEKELQIAANNIASFCMPQRVVYQYIRRGATNLTNADDAIFWLSATIDEITAILGGESLISIDRNTLTIVGRAETA